MTYICPKCGRTSLPGEAPRCPYCGAKYRKERQNVNANLNPLREKQTRRTRDAHRKAALRFAVVLAVFVALSLMVWTVRP